METLFFGHLFSCLFLTGLIWTIQRVHYPSFAFVDQQKFADFNRFHQKEITWVVAPLMIFELFSGLILLVGPWKQEPLFVFSFLLVVGIWLSTFFLSVPLHQRLLSGGFDLQDIQRLVVTNWPRTLMWSLRSTLLLYLFFNHQGVFHG